MPKAATGSAHHRPRSAFRASPPSRIADKEPQMSVWRESASIAPLAQAASDASFGAPGSA